MISSSLYIINIKNNYNNNNIDNNIILDNREEKSYIKEITLVRNRDLNKKKEAGITPLEDSFSIAKIKFCYFF